MLLLKLKLFLELLLNSAFLSNCWAGSVSGKHDYSAARPADARWVHQTAWFAVHREHAWGDTAMHLKTVPVTLAVGMQQVFRVRVGHFPLWISPKHSESPLCQHHPCIRGLFSGSARMTGLTYLQFKRENSQLTKEAMFHFSHAFLFFSFRNVELFEGQGLLRCVGSSSLSLKDRTMCSVALHPIGEKKTFAKWKQVNQLNTSALIRLQGDGVTCKTDKIKCLSYQIKVTWRLKHQESYSPKHNLITQILHSWYTFSVLPKSMRYYYIFI